MKRLPLLLSLLAVILLSASIAYWVLQLYKPQQRPLTAPPVVAVPEPATDAAVTLFGGQAMTAVASNYQLTGVVAAGKEGVAILVADGQPAKALPVGKEVAPGVMVKEVHPRYVMLSEGGVMKRIDLAADTKPAAEMAPPPPPPMPMPMPVQPAPQEQASQPPPTQGQEAPEPQPAPMGRPSDAGGAPPAASPPPPPPVQMPPQTRNVQGL